VDRIKAANAIAFLLLLSACGEALPPFQVTALAGETAGLDRYEGRWFDQSGNLIAVVRGGTEPQFGIRLPEGFTLKTAILQGGGLVFRWQLAESTTSASFRLSGENQAFLTLVATPGNEPVGCFCCWLPDHGLLRNPSSAWFVRQSARNTAELGKKAYENTFDWLAQVL